MDKPNPSWFPLIAHKVGRRLYNLSAGLSYVSIKDQVVRACALVDSLNGAGALNSSATGSKVFDVVVVGAGAAGVTAAWRAAALGKRVCIVEKSDAPFSAQAKCNDRIVSFSMYDWPESFSTAGVFPSLSGLPFPGEGLDKERFPCYCDSEIPLRASEHAKNWMSRLDLSGVNLCASTASQPIAWRFNATASYVVPPDSDYMNDSGTLTVEIDDGTGAKSHIYAANLIVATGIGLERQIDSYQPTAFWSDDLRAPWHQVPTEHKRSVVISGAGDGAIQDVLKSLWTTEIFDLIPVVEDLLGRPGAMARNQAILAAERHAERQLLWGGDDAKTYRALQSVYETLVNNLSAARVTRWRKKYLRKDIHVDWIVGVEGTFSKTYPLNRILGVALRRPEFNQYVKFHKDRIYSIEEGSQGEWRCTTKGGVVLMSEFPPILRHGVETQDVDIDSFDRDTLRTALSRAPVPFKPFDF